MIEASAKTRGERAHSRGLAVNLGLAATKVVVGFATGSQSLLADGWHSMSDGVTNGAAWLAYRLGGAPPDEDHHYGHGNFEALAGLLVGLVLTGGGLGIVWSATGYGHHVETTGDGVVAIAVALVSIVANVYLTRITLAAGRELNSPSLLALARDNGADVLTSFLVIAAVGATLGGVEWAEPLVTALIGGLVTLMGVRSVHEGLGILTGRVADPTLRDSLIEVAGAVEGVLGVQRARVQPVGSSYHVDMEISVDGALTVARGHEIAHAVERAVTNAHTHVVEVHVHVNPAAGTGEGAP